MLLKCTSLKEALAAARVISDEHNVVSYVCSCSDHVHYVAGPSSVHLLPGVSSQHSPWGGLSLGTKVFPDPDLADVLALPRKQEKWYQLVATNTTGYSHLQILQLAKAIDENDTCIWHEVARMEGTLDRCPCGSCSDRRSMVRRLAALPQDILSKILEG